MLIMGIKTSDVPDRVIGMLGEMAIEGQLVRQHPRVLERKDYEALNRVLEALGGKWSRHKRGHLFPDELRPADLIEAALTTGTFVDPKENDFFPTPPELARQLVERAGVKPGDEVLEPSAGKGALAVAATAAGGVVTCFELLPENCAALKKLGIPCEPSDFLKVAPRYVQPRYDRVVMNPPFGKAEWIEHVRLAHRWLKPGGTMVSVLPAGATFRTDARHADFRAWVARLGASIESLPDDSFASSGTRVRTALFAVGC